MKRLIFILSLLLAFTACEDEQESTPQPVAIPTAQDSILNYKGNFIAAGEAAVLKGSQFVYQVKIDSLTQAFKNSIEEYKTENRSVIPVEVKGKVKDNPSPAGYSQIIEIEEFVEIFAEKKAEKTIDDDNKEK